MTQSTRFSNTQEASIFHEFFETEAKIRALTKHIDENYDDGRNKYRKEKKTYPHRVLATITAIWNNKGKLSPGSANLLDDLFNEQYLGYIKNYMKVNTDLELAEIYRDLAEEEIRDRVAA